MSIQNATRPIRRARRRPEAQSAATEQPAHKARAFQPGAIQVFVFDCETFTGSQLFGVAEPLTIGRHHTCQLELEADTVSRHHCRVVREGGRLYVEDLGSGNGTFVNRRRVESREALCEGDTLGVGPYTLRLKLLRSGKTRSPETRRSTETTRIDAVLHVEPLGGDSELPVRLPSAFDQRLYEAALRRKTGGEIPARPLERGAGNWASDPVPEDEMDESSTLMPGHTGARLGLEMRARLRSLDALIASLDALAPPPLPSDVEDVPSSPGARVISLEGWLRAAGPRCDSGDLEDGSTVRREGPIAGAAGRRAASEAPPIDGDTIPERDESSIVREARATARRDEVRLLARLLTPTSMRIAMSGAPGLEDRPRVAGPAPAADGFDGVEIAARVAGRLVDITVLRKESEQYVLGHRTPQGALAPGRAHLGLRLLKINEDRSVDLVFPQDVGGHLVREGACVTLGELTEGRKYSCLRLEPTDVATVILGHGENVTSYHLRFLRGPESLFRSLRRTLA